MIDLDSAIDSLNFFQIANGGVLCYGTIPAEFPCKIINFKTDLIDSCSPEHKTRHHQKRVDVNVTIFRKLLAILHKGFKAELK